MAIFCFAAGVACLVYALLERYRWGMWLRHGKQPTGPPTAAVFMVAVTLLALATTVVIIDDKVASAGAQAAAPAAPGPTAPLVTEPAPAASRDESVVTYPLSDDDLGNFAGVAQGASRSLRSPLCLVQFYDGDVSVGEKRSYKWWTSCGEARRFSTISDVRTELALPPAWGERNELAVACVPKGSAVAYVKGKAAPVQSKGRRFDGGGVQYRVLRFDVDWIVSHKRLPDAGRPLPALDPQQC